MGSLILDLYYSSTLVLLVEFNMTFKSSLLFLAMLVGSCYGSCNRTISGYTWKFNATVDKDYSGISKEECAEKCLSFSWCRGYTWSLDDSSGSSCHIFHELKQQHACQQCSKCFSGVFKQISGGCYTEASNIIGIKQSSSEMSCIEMCAETPGCKYYSWGAGHIFSDKCILYKMCDPKPSCEAWQSGQLQCVTAPSEYCNFQKVPTSCLASSEYSRKYSCEKSYNGNWNASDFISWASKGEGVGAWIEVTFKKATNIKLIKLLQRKNNFEQNSEVRLDFDDGTSMTRPVPIKGPKEFNSIELPKRIRTRSVKITITKIDSKYNNGWKQIVFYGC